MDAEAQIRALFHSWLDGLPPETPPDPAFLERINNSCTGCERWDHGTEALPGKMREDEIHD